MPDEYVTGEWGGQVWVRKMDPAPAPAVTAPANTPPGGPNRGRCPSWPPRALSWLLAFLRGPQGRVLASGAGYVATAVANSLQAHGGTLTRQNALAALVAGAIALSSFRSTKYAELKAGAPDPPSGPKKG